VVNPVRDEGRDPVKARDLGRDVAALGKRAFALWNLWTPSPPLTLLPWAPSVRSWL
jgi:hypothetical protein